MGIGTPRSHNRAHPTRPVCAFSNNFLVLMTTSPELGQETCPHLARAALAQRCAERGTPYNRPLRPCTAPSSLILLWRLGLDRSLALETARHEPDRER